MVIMSKMKTHSGAKKRFKKVGNGKIKKPSAYRRHLLTKKTSKQKRNLRGASYVCAADSGRLSQII